MSTMPVRVDPELLRLVRLSLLSALRPRLEAVYSDETTAVEYADRKRSGRRGLLTPRTMVSLFNDPQFVERFGVGLEKVHDTTLVEFALEGLVRTIRDAPDGKTGVPLFDDMPASDE